MNELPRTVSRIQIDTNARRAILVATFFILAAANIYIAKWGFANMVSTRADRPDVADLAVGLAPSDPQTHYSAAVLYDRTFLVADQERSLLEYETAVALSPHNYLLWLEYGKALGRNGDSQRAETAFRRARELAPNYASVAWALGNLLVRNGNDVEGFAEIRRAIDGDPSFAAPAAAFSYQYFNGDLTAVRKVIEGSSAANASLSLLLARDKRFDEAAAVWQSIGPKDKNENILTAGRSLVAAFIAAKKFGYAMQVDNSVDPQTASVPYQIRDGGFEEGIKLENAGPFEWQISAGAQPQPLQSTSQPHGGGKELVLRFTYNDGSALRQIVQTVVVRPNAKYMLHGFYRSDLKTSSQIAWQVLDGSNGAVLVESLVGAPVSDWTESKAAFTVPADTDGVQIRLLVRGCGSSICPINGSLWLDDISLIAN